MVECVRFLRNGIRGFVFGALFLISVSRPSYALDVKSDFKKDPATGRMVGYAEAVLPKKPDSLWPILTDAIHGKLSDRTKLCAFVGEEHAKQIGVPSSDQSWMPVPADQEDQIRGKLEAVLLKSVPSVAVGQLEERYVFRKVHVPIPFTSDRWFLAREVHDAKTGLKDGVFKLKIDGLAGNVRFYHSEWLVTPDPQGARVRLDITSDMGITVPGFLVGLGGKELVTSMNRFAKLAGVE